MGDVPYDFDAWKARLDALVDDAVAGGPLGKMRIQRLATDDRAGFDLTVTWPGQQKKPRKPARKGGRSKR